MDCDVLIVGAGPTGLVLALWLVRAGVRVRIIDKAPEPGTASRALVVHARTLEFYRQLGIAGRITAAGLPFAAINLWVRGRRRAHVRIGDVGRGLTPFPEMLILPQDVHERLLIAALQSLGTEVERSAALTAIDQRDDAVNATVVTAGATLRITARFAVGCDGAHSAVREALSVGFPGGTYERLFYVADVEASRLMNKELHVALDEADLLAIFPLAGEQRGRLLGTVRPDAVHRATPLTWEDVSPTALAHLGVEVSRVNWFSTYHVHHRVARTFRRGPVFLAGDAAHIHSPVGGQGMNTGIGDAVNLAWKLADVVHGRLNASVLDTYEPERIAFARRLVATTDRAFVLATRDGPVARLVRLRAIPLVLPLAMRVGAVRRWMFRTLSQTAIEYRRSRLSSGHRGRVRGGDRLPWVENADSTGGDNYAPVEERTWQVHVYGATTDAFAAACAARGLKLYRFPWKAAMRRAGFARDTAVLVRPDGYVASVFAANCNGCVTLPPRFAQGAGAG